MMSNAAKRVWEWIGHLSTLAWLGLGATFYGLIRAISELPVRDQVILGVGMALLAVVVVIRAFPLPAGARGLRYGSRRDWRASHECGHQAGVTGIRVDLKPQHGQTVDTANLLCSVRGPKGFGGGYTETQIRPPESSGADGVLNDFYYAFLSHQRASKLMSDGWYVVTWDEHVDVGMRPLARSFFKIRNGSCVPRRRR